ncbi:RING-type domain-containing protein [Mycena kentingensis (nom. inval.)]|nr:RING-type domain-containing protein [Mycena kentingensis (nom. inval.)]
MAVSSKLRITVWMDPPQPPHGDSDDEPGERTSRRIPVPHFLFLSFLLYTLTHNGDEFIARARYQDALHHLSSQLGNYSAWLNGTESNFTMPAQDSAVPPLLHHFSVEGAPLNSAWAYYSNSTGTYHGDATFYNLTSMNGTGLAPLADQYTENFNMTLALDKMGSWNWSASNKIALSLGERPAPPSNVSQRLTMVHGKLELTDEWTAEELRLDFEGIHFLTNGSMFALAQPPGQVIDLRYLPSIVPQSSRNDTADVVEPELVARIAKLKQLIDAGVIEPDPAADEPVRTACPFVLYIAQDPVQVQQHLLDQLEDEIQHPTGIRTVHAPPMSFRGLLLSKECGIMYEFNKTEGLGLRSLFRKLTTYAGGAAVAYLIMLVLFSRQMQQSRTPSGISKLSFLTFMVQAVVDSLSFAGHTVFALVADGKPSLSLIAPAFLACVLFANEAQFAMLIYQFQAPEDVSSPPTPAVIPSPSEATIPGVPDPLASNPVSSLAPPSIATSPTARAPPSPLPPPVVQEPSNPSFWHFLYNHLRHDPQMRIWIILFFILAVLVHAILSAILSIVIIIVSYSLFWSPQILRSIRRGRGSGLSTEYLVGTTLCRLAIALYFLLCPKNVLDIEPRPWSRYLALFVFLQVGVVILQESRLGPTFFLPKRYATPKVYDYHPIMPLPDDDPESPEQSLGDCAICMDAIYVDPSAHRRRTSLDEKTGERTSGRRGRGGILDAVGVGAASARQSYSLAPCHHLFHTECLERWLAIKNICPQCRRPLPPL